MDTGMDEQRLAAEETIAGADLTITMGCRELPFPVRRAGTGRWRTRRVRTTRGCAASMLFPGLDLPPSLLTAPAAHDED